MSDTSTVISTREFRGGDKTPTSLAAFRSARRSGRPAQTLADPHRLVRLRQAIVEGFYQVDPRRIACKLLKRD